MDNETEEPIEEEKKLYLTFHGRIIDSLGIQMYQSPVAAIAELVANAWDADAKQVQIELPTSLGQGGELSVIDDGNGMTFEQCQDYYLNVGRNRREDLTSDITKGGRPVLGRKGIGKFAGFGIAEVLVIDTISGETGERTKFRLDLRELRGDAYLGAGEKPVEVMEAEGPDDDRKSNKGTTIKLQNLKITRKPGAEAFRKSMARRFLINQTAADFEVLVDGDALPDDNALADIQYDFPNDYTADEIPDGVTIDEGWAVETLDGGDTVKWRIKFTNTPITNEELCGVSIFCGIKLAQTPFNFLLTGGISGQHAQQYVSGMVRADYIDDQAIDIITTERQRINWENSEAAPLLSWGKMRLKTLFALWKKRRGQSNVDYIEGKVSGFNDRLERLRPAERRVVKGAIQKIASISTIDLPQFEALAKSILTSWEGGRLQELIRDVERVEEMDEGVLLSLLVETNVLNALHVAEAVKTKLSIIEGLQNRIENRELENAVRDYISINPWLLSPKWETFKVETSVSNLVSNAATAAQLDKFHNADPENEGKKRVDLVLRSGDALLVVEFMRPGLTVDYDHLGRYNVYISALRAAISANTGTGIRVVTGLLVAEKLAKKAGVELMLKEYAEDGKLALEWKGLLLQAEAQWKEFLDVLVERAPDDERLLELRDTEVDVSEVPEEDDLPEAASIQ